MPYIGRMASVSLEIAHLGEDGVMHGHSLIAEVWTHADTCLDAWRAKIVATTAHINLGQLETTIFARTFEDVAIWILDAMPEAYRVVIRLPTYGHAIEVYR
jgi:hypothetical protein